MSLRTLEQRRAEHALRRVREVDGNAKDDKTKSDYRSYVSSFAAHVLIGGLGQAAATVLAQAGDDASDAHALLYQHVCDWLCGGDQESPYPAGNLVEQLMTNDQATYLVAQAEALAYVEWLKRFAAAFLPRRKELG